MNHPWWHQLHDLLQKVSPMTSLESSRPPVQLIELMTLQILPNGLSREMSVAVQELHVVVGVGGIPVDGSHAGDTIWQTAVD